MSFSKRPRSNTSYQNTTKEKKAKKLPGVPLPEDSSILAEMEPMTDSKFKQLVKANFVWASKAVRSMDVFQTSWTLEELSSRSREPSKELLEKVKKLENQEPQVLSGHWVDREGKTLAVYFAWSKDPKQDPSAAGPSKKDGDISQGKNQGNKKGKTRARKKKTAQPKPSLSDVSRPLSEQYAHRTISTLPWDLESRRYYGISNDDLKVVQTASQYMHSALPPHYNPRDARHTKNSAMMSYEVAAEKVGTGDWDLKALSVLESEVAKERADIRQTTPDEDDVQLELKEERTGVTHLVHCWFPQGHKERMVPSADMARTGQGAMAVKTYFVATQKLSAQLTALFKAAYPEYYKRYKKAFAAGVWIKEDKGPWIGRAIVWKLQVGLHVDGLDEGPALCFPCGDYTGAELCLPDLDAKFKYSPGDVIIFMAGKLFHCVTKWEPAPMEEGQHCTPGRIGHVFFFPEKSYQALKDKPAGWSASTNGGYLKLEKLAGKGTQEGGVVEEEVLDDHS